MISFRTTKSRRAFTLIELLIVITIIGVLAVALIPKIAGAPGRARDAQRKTDLNTIAIGLEAYYADFGAYPTASSGDEVDALSISGYFNASDIPNDPQSTTATNYSAGCTTAGSYCYKSLDTAQHYVITANLESEPLTSSTKSPSLILAATFTSATSIGTSSSGLYYAIITGENCNTGSANTCVFAITK